MARCSPRSTTSSSRTPAGGFPRRTPRYPPSESSWTRPKTGRVQRDLVRQRDGDRDRERNREVERQILRQDRERERDRVRQREREREWKSECVPKI